MTVRELADILKEYDDDDVVEISAYTIMEDPYAELSIRDDTIMESDYND